MAIRESSAVWTGNLTEGNGSMRLGSGAYEGVFSRASRFEDGPGTNPEELIGAAHAGCFSMYLSLILSKAGHIPTRIDTTAKVHLGEGPKITLIELSTVGEVPGIDEKRFIEFAEQAKKGCPVSQALAAVDINLKARLAQGELSF
ncbi:MAG TPA: OsmC family protein [Anaerolineales bacterium]|nr:OsmC family protein [Anaerolineales bacterium]